MSDYLTRATTALDGFMQARAALAADAAELLRAGDVPAAPLRRAAEALERLDAAGAALGISFSHLANTALDVVDLQTRLEGESASVASGLRALGEAVESSAVLRTALLPGCVALEEAAAALASATFPSAVEGLAEVNRALWDFRGPVWVAYERALADVVGRRTLTPQQVARIEQTAAGIKARFEAVDALLNELASSPFHERAAVLRMVREARTALERALAEARGKATDTYRPFHGVHRRAEGVAERVLKSLGRCRVPAFPSAEAISQETTCIDGQRYASLGGSERFALLNILAALRAVRPPDAAAPSLADGTFMRRIFAVFPDRIYVEANPPLLTTLAALRERGVFAPAPAALHRFREASLKQREHRKGNLQFSYERAGDVVRADIDIDLYRGPVSHLFGEVLINQLTGSTTSQFVVRRILDARGVPPIAGFEVVVPDA